MSITLPRLPPSAKLFMGNTRSSLLSKLPRQLFSHQYKTTVNQEEISNHTRHVMQWWDPFGPMKALHSFNCVRVPFIRDGMVQISLAKRTTLPLSGKKILDVGCGGGILSEALARLGAEVTGIDASKELIEVAQSHSFEDIKLRDRRPNYYHTTIEEHMTEYRNYYDSVVASEVIEHINNEHKELFVKSCLSTLKPGGRIFFTTPCRTLLSQVTVIYMTEYLFNMVPRGTHTYEKFTTPTELTFLLERNGCHVEMIVGLFYQVLSNRWYFVTNQSQMFALQAVKH